MRVVTPNQTTRKPRASNTSNVAAVRLHDPEITISVVDRATDNAPAADRLTWPEIVRVLRGAVLETTCPGSNADEKALREENKKRLPMFIPARFREGGTRNRADVEALTLGALDLDQLTPDQYDGLFVALGGTRAVLYTSPSDDATTGKRKARVVVALDRELSPDECGRFRRGLATGLEVEADKSTTADPSRGFFLGRFEDDPDREFHEFEGEPIKVAAVLNLAPELVAATPLSDAPQSDEPLLSDDEHRAIADAFEPFSELGQRHALAKAFGGWARQRGLSRGDVASIVDLLGFEDPDARLEGALACYDADNANGFQALLDLGLDARTLDAFPNPKRAASEALNERFDEVVASRLASLPATGGTARQRATAAAAQIKQLQAHLERAKQELSKTSTAIRNDRSEEVYNAHEGAKAEVDRLKIAIADAKAAKAQAAAETLALETRLDPSAIEDVKITDAGMAEAIAAQYANRLIYCESRRAWFSWDGRQWSKEDGQAVATQTVFELSRQLQKHAGNGDDDPDKRKRRFAQAVAYEGAPKAAGAIAALKTIPVVRVKAQQLDADAELLNCANGVVDLKTGDVLPHDPARLMTRCTGVAYNPDAESELWGNYLDDLTGGDGVLRGYLQRAAGSSLWGYPTDKAFFFLWGVRDSGKSRFLDALRAALGEYAGVADFSTWLQQTAVGGNRGDLVDLAGTRVVVSSEVRKTAKLNSELVKAVTGGDTLKFAAKYEKDVTFKPTFTLWWAANDQPRVRADDEGFWGRAKIVGCQNAIPKERQNPRLAELWVENEHAEAILAWLVKGCLAWRAEGLGVCPSVEAEIAAYRESQDPTAEFWVDCIQASGAGQHGPFLSRAVLWRAWERWVEENGGDGAQWVKQRDLYAKVLERFPGAVATAVSGTRGFRGIEQRQSGAATPPISAPRTQTWARPASVLSDQA